MLETIDIAAKVTPIRAAYKIAGTDIPDPATAFELSPDLPFPSNALVLKATGELPVSIPHKSDFDGLSTRNVQADPLSDWWMYAPDKIPPKQISSILRMALAGSLWQQTTLAQRMRDSWPMFRKCEYELRAAVASSKFVVHPYTVKGKKPTPSAEEKADLIWRSLEGFNPDRFADEDGLNGMAFDLAGGVTDGVSICEMLWDEDAIDTDGKNESRVRASAWVHPRNLAFQPDGRIGIAYQEDTGYLSFANAAKTTVNYNPDKFLVAKFKSKSGSCLGAGFMRPLALMWVMVMYPRDYAMLFMQKYGNPFMDIAYSAGITDPKEIDRFERLAKQAAASGYFVHPDSAKLVIGSEHKMGADNPQLVLMHLADEACQLLMLGQTLTSTAPINGGTRAQGDVHENVRQERIEEIAKWIARILTEQFTDSILRVNYGKSYLRNPERPTVEVDLTRPLSATEQADFLQKISNSTVAILTEEAYKRVGFTQPSPGDKVLVRGQQVILEEAMTPTEKQEQDFETQLGQQVAISQMQQPEKPEPGNRENVEATNRISPHYIYQALSKADPDEIGELENLVLTAEAAPRNNGVFKAAQAAVENKIDQILLKQRR